MAGGGREKEGEKDNSPFSLRFVQRLKDRPHGFLFHADLALEFLIRSLEGEVNILRCSCRLGSQTPGGNGHLSLPSLCPLYNLLLRCYLCSQPAKVTKSPTIPKEFKKQPSLLSYYEQWRARKQPSGSLRVHTHSLCSHCIEVHCPRVSCHCHSGDSWVVLGMPEHQASSGPGNNHILSFDRLLWSPLSRQGGD